MTGKLFQDQLGCGCRSMSYLSEFIVCLWSIITADTHQLASPSEPYLTQYRKESLCTNIAQIHNEIFLTLLREQ